MTSLPLAWRLEDFARIDIVKASAKDCVHMWLLDLRAERQSLDNAAAVLSAVELSQQVRLQGEDAQRRFLVAHACTRYVLAQCTGAEATSLCFEYGRNGKPVLVHSGHAKAWHFNLSHAEDYALIAIARGREVGVDLEHVGERPRALSIARRHFQPNEVAELEALPPAERPVGFIRYWVAKEAAVKCVGGALVADLQRCSIEWQSAHHGVARFSDAYGEPREPTTRLAIRLPPVAKGWMAAVAAEGNDWRVEWVTC